MAASIQMEEYKPAENQENALKSVIIQFFEMVPIRRMKWESESVSRQHLDVLTQREVLNKTVRSQICRKYPPAIGYRKAFVKKLLQVLEDYGVEICDEIYEVYTELLEENDGGDEMMCYKTYTIDGGNSNHVTLQESVNIVSFGTTGLSTWQAAQHLSEWIIQNKQLFENKNVLELGSGLGLTGIITCKQCQVKSFTFTDLHKQVLELLANNIHINLSHMSVVDDGQSSHDGEKSANSDLKMVNSPNFPNKCLQTENLSNNCGEGESLCEAGNISISSSDNCDKVLQSDKQYEGNVELDHTVQRGDIDLLDLDVDQWERHASFGTYLYKNRAGIRLAPLDWENLKDPLMDHLSDTDIVLAADVVYDNRIIPYLVLTLKKVLYSNLHKSVPTCAYLASTIRNEDTRDQFLITLSSEGLNYQQVEGPKLWLFHYDKSVPIEILKITAADV